MKYKGICLAFLIIINTTWVLPRIISKSAQFATALVLLIYTIIEVYDFLNSFNKQ
jgi:hypothetical protein